MRFITYIHFRFTGLSGRVQFQTSVCCSVFKGRGFVIYIQCIWKTKYYIKMQTLHIAQGCIYIYTQRVKHTLRAVITIFFIHLQMIVIITADQGINGVLHLAGRAYKYVDSEI